MLTFTFLGVGNAFAKRNYQSNVLVEAWSKGPDHQAAPDDTVLIDFGTTGPFALHALKDRPGFEYLARNGQVHYPGIRRIFITHQHADHIGGLEEMALTNTFLSRDPQTGKGFKPQIISSINILVNLWDHSLKGGLNTVPGRYALLQDYFFIQALRPGEPGHERFHLLKRYCFEIFPTDHVKIERKYDWPSYGLYLTDTQSGQSVFFSGDSRFDYAAYADRMGRAKICFHEVQLIEEPEPVHSLISEMRTLPPEVKKKTILYHYGDMWDSGPFGFVDQEFAGFAEPQRRYVLFE
ncbi:MAG TPA: MBL fold metallo-hydrolase [Phycisphaerae bacterium]|nr:MBL fold metallo-hydrolase [Phycisphaerae bacterium]